MNPYLAATIAMCLITLISLAITAYLAVFFNRRAKADLQAALLPLAEVVTGDLDLDAAEVRGRYGEYLAFARMTKAQEGLGREFQTEIIDAAGGDDWHYKSAVADADSLPHVIFTCNELTLRAQIDPYLAKISRSGIDPRRERFSLAYSAASGHIRLVRPMRTRRDIPEASTLDCQLNFLVSLAEVNRIAQGSLNWAGNPE